MTSKSAELLGFEDVYGAHADFVWRSLQRLGARSSEVPDLFQDVFVVVHRKLHTFDGTSRVTTWLFGICLRIIKAHRRRAYFRRERLVDCPPDREPLDDSSPESAVVLAQARTRLGRILDALPVEKRAVFVMFEIDGMTSEQIAGLMGIPVGTVYSRLHSARQTFVRVLERTQRPGGSR